jgi:C-terminal processing protease CtpA/Prc
MSRPRALAPLLAAVALLACGGDDEELDLCGPDVEKRALADLVYDWYLYPETLPSIVDTSQFATSAELLDHMTADAQRLGMDRGWSFVTTAAASTTYFTEGKSVGFGLGLLVRGADVLVSSVYPDSPAAERGFARGDRLLRVGETEATLVEVTPTTLGGLLGASTEGVTRAIEVAPGGDGAPVVHVVTKRTFDLDPVPVVDEAGDRWRIVERSGTKLGYVALRTFVATAHDPLQEAFAAFKAAGVTRVVVDLRYNGGGLVSTGELLANLLGGGLAGQIMVTVANNGAHVLQNEEGRFGQAVSGQIVDLANAIGADRLAFITTGASASASELVPNVLEPYKPDAIAFVGATTHGKPVGQRGFRLRSCESVVYLVSFKLENAQGDGEYFAGLPDAPADGGEPAFSGPLCGAEDDLRHALGEDEEASTAAALHWLETGTCLTLPVAKPGAPGALKAAAPPDVYPEAPDPTVAQRHVRGLF